MDDSADHTASTADGTSVRRGVDILPPGTRVGRYVLLADIGLGGMGVIYKAYDPQLERPIALKLLRATGDDEAASRFRERLLREAQALAQLAHPNVVAVHDVGTFGDGVFIAMEFVEGQTLTRWVKERPHKLDKLLRIYLAAGEGLAAAHRAGLVHRDFKPDNVLVGDDGRVRVLDFGLARVAAADEALVERERREHDSVAAPAAGAAAEAAPLDGKAEITQSTVRTKASAATPAPSSPPEASTPATTAPPPATPPAATPLSASMLSSSGETRHSTRLLNSPLTREGTILGTPRFMAPEQHLSEHVDERADQFSFCVSLYQAVYQQFPFGGRNLDELKDNVVHGRMEPPPAGARVPRWLHKLLVRGLAVRPADRHPAMDALLDQLRRRLERERTRIFAVALGVAVVAGFAIWGGLGWRARALERAELCQGGARRLAGVWDDAAKARVRDALLGSGKPYAADVWKNVEATLDRRAAEWVAMHKDSCEATRLRGEQTDQVMTLRMVCLDRKLGDLGALVDVLAHADAAMLQKAPAAAAGLGSLDACADVPSLIAEVPPPSDPALRERIAGIRQQLSRAEALRLAGRSANAAEVADKAVVAARQTQNRPIIAEALFAAGRADEKVDPGRGAKELTEAFWDAFASRMDRVAVAASVLAVREYAMILRFDDSAAWEKSARAGLDRIGGDDELESELWTSLFFRAYEQQRRDEQVADAERAARLAERRFGFDDLRTINRQQNELTAYSNAYRVIEGWRKRGPLLSRQERLLGAQHPMLARSLMDFGDDEVQIGHLADARAHLARAEQLLRAAGETETLQWTALRTYQQRLALTEGKLDEAEAMGKESLAVLERLKILDSERGLDQRLALARIAARRGHAAEATAMMRRQLADSERSHGQENLELGEILGVMADVCVDTGQIAAAREAAERNLALVRRFTPDSRYALAEANLMLARVRLSDGKAAEALALVDESERALRDAVGDDGPVVCKARRVRGEALSALGRFDEAATALRSALEVATRGGFDPAEQKTLRAALERAQARGGAKPRVSATP